MALGEHYTPEWTALRKAASMSVSVRSRRGSMLAMSASLIGRLGSSAFRLTIVRDDEVCRRLMTTPGVGAVVALTCRATHSAWALPDSK